MSIKFKCCRCEQSLECDDEFGSVEITCPTCNELTMVPPAAVPAKQPPAMPKSGMTYVPESWRKPKTPPQADAS